uniref:DUF87 domain-containing protein n=1 Tax=Fervidicoccus fontis TaxID=683846 RepID=A0A7J3ZK52_9CREN
MLIPLFASPLVALLYNKTFKVGLIRNGERFVSGSVKRVELLDSLIVFERRDRGYIGIACIGLDDTLFSEKMRSPEDFFSRALILGRLLSNVKAEVELRIAKVSIDVMELSKKIERELSSLRVLLESQSTDERLLERERGLKRLYEKIRSGEKVGWMKPYIILRASDDSKERVVSALEREAEELARAITITLGVQTRVLKSKELGRMLEAMFATTPPVKISLGGEEELSKALAMPPYERESLDPRGVFLGYRVGTKIPFLYDVVRHGTRHILVIGPTGKGKTTLLATIANRLYVRNQVDVTVIDPKGDTEYMLLKGFSRFRISSSTVINSRKASLAFRVLEGVYGSREKWFESVQNGVYGRERNEGGPMTFEELERALGVKLLYADPPSREFQLNSIVTERYSAIILDNLTDDGRFVAIAILMSLYLEALYRTTPTNRLRRLLVIDEAWRSSEAALYYTRRLVKESRGFGVGLLFSTQTVKDVPEDVIHNFGTIIAFGSADSSYVESIIRIVGYKERGIDKKLQALGVGQAMIKLPDLATLSFIDIDPEVL